MARFFAPAVVAERYGALMGERADALLANVDGEEFALDDLALTYSFDVTGHVVELTNFSVPAMARRVAPFFRQPPFDLSKPRLGRTRRQWARAAADGLLPLVRFHLADVSPAIRQRRSRPADDKVWP